MKRWTSTERWALGIGVVLFLGGLAAVIWPQAGVVPHFTNNAIGTSGRVEVQPVSEIEARACGIIGMVLGVGFIFMAVYRGK